MIKMVVRPHHMTNGANRQTTRVYDGVLYGSNSGGIDEQMKSAAYTKKNSFLSGISFDKPNEPTIQISDSGYLFDANGYISNSALISNKVSTIKPLSHDWSSGQSPNDNGGLGSDFFSNKAKMEEQGDKIKQLTQTSSNGDRTVNAAAQLFVGATGDVSQIGNNQQVGLIGHGGKRSRKYRKKRHKKSKRRYRRASGKSKV